MAVIPIASVEKLIRKGGVEREPKTKMEKTNPGDEFEKIAFEMIQQIYSGLNAEFHQRKVYPGAKDPNGYQIDISIELMLEPGTFLLIIVECKDHVRPVERSVVQQFIQVRDDISAHKAIIASTSGFNKGAVRLAEKNNIGLWIIEKENHTNGKDGLSLSLADRTSIKNNRIVVHKAEPLTTRI